MHMKEQDMKIDIMHALRDFLDAYDDHAEMVVTEAIGNAIDVGASTVRITLKTDMDDNALISFHNDGPGMNKKQFEDYHVIARSSKIKGKSIGFAGIGAKVYLAAWPEKTAIHTETSDGDISFGSDMYVRGGTLKYTYVEPGIKKAGTLYQVKLKSEDYQKLTSGINFIVADAFTPAMVKGLKVYVNGTIVKPWKPEFEFRKSFTINAKGKRCQAVLMVTKDDIPSKKQYFQYHVSGKIVMNKRPDWHDEVISRYRDRICAFVDATDLSDSLNLNKTSFKSVHQTNVAAMLKESSRRAYELLKKEGYVEKETMRKWEQTPLTRFFQKLFKDPDFSWLNPEPMGGAGGAQRENDTNTGRKRNASDKQRKSENTGRSPGDPPRGGGTFSITYIASSNDTKDGWLDQSTNRVVINLEHPLFIKYENSIPARNQRIGSIITSVLIKNGSAKKAMEPSEALDLHTKILTMARDAMW